MKSVNHVAYPVFFKNTENGYVVWNDSIPMASQGRNLEEALYMAKDAIELLAYDSFLSGEEFVSPKECDKELPLEADFLSFIICDLDRYFRLESDKKVKKNCTIPESLAKAAEERGINFSRVLTHGLEKELNLV